MKGRPKYALLEVCRVWECPACKRKARTPGHVVNLACSCKSKKKSHRTTWMRLVEDLPHHPRRTEPPGDQEAPPS
jgi:hypothetical protein